jgi:uncharacterized LabA/DUF88 family protein
LHDLFPQLLKQLETLTIADLSRNAPGLDIASMAHKRQVSQMVLISGDSDFVPAAKYARREGIDFILDPLRANIRPDLSEHIDGLKTWVAKTQK